MAGTKDDMNATIKIRRHPFFSPEVRFLVAELDKSLAERYPDWDQLSHPILQANANPKPSEEDIAKAAAREAATKDNLDAEQQERKEGLVFWVAFDTAPSSDPSSVQQGNDGPSTAGKGRAIACAALRIFGTPDYPMPPQFDSSLRWAELKRIYVLPEYRGRGISKLLVKTVEEYARNEGKIDVIVIETGTRQFESIKLCEGARYQRREMFGAYVGADPVSGGVSACFEKRLS